MLTGSLVATEKASFTPNLPEVPSTPTPTALSHIIEPRGHIEERLARLLPANSYRQGYSYRQLPGFSFAPFSAVPPSIVALFVPVHAFGLVSFFTPRVIVLLAVYGRDLLAGGLLLSLCFLSDFSSERGWSGLPFTWRFSRTSSTILLAMEFGWGGMECNGSVHIRLVYHHHRRPPFLAVFLDTKSKEQCKESYFALLEAPLSF